MGRLSLSLVAAALVACGGQVPDPEGKPGQLEAPQDSGALTEGDGTLATLLARGSFSCDFQISPTAPLSEVPPAIERDRMYMAAQPGIVRKMLPIGIDTTNGVVYSGGRYLFDTVEHAQDYKTFVEQNYYLDGVEFLSRPLFIAPECHAWKVIGVYQRLPLAQQLVMRTERFAVSGPPLLIELQLLARLPALIAEVNQRGLASVWLTYDAEEGLAQVVMYADRVQPADPTQIDFNSLFALENAPAPGAPLEDLGAMTFDRTEWVFDVWFPFEKGDSGRAALWPWSPPFPGPGCGDGVCEPSRGETGESCPQDCPAKCGDAICEAGEDTMNCPSDCRIPSAP